jgi:hypothetical protein
VSIRKEEIIEILKSKTGQRLLACILLVQPITCKELNQFPKLCFELFNPHNPIPSDKFPNVAKIKKNEVYPQFKPLFDNTELYKRILPKAVYSGLIKKIPEKKEGGKNYYYFLNSDIFFEISRDGLKIKEASEIFSRYFTHNIMYPNSNKKLKELINIHVSSPKNISDENVFHFRSISYLLKTLYWLSKYPSQINDILNFFLETYSKVGKYNIKKQQTFINDLPTIRRDILQKAIDDDVLIVKKDYIEPGPVINGLLKNRYKLYFTPSYSIYRCFSNFSKNIGLIVRKEEWCRKISPMDLLKILSSRNYEIDSEKRSKIFTSLLLSSFNITNSSSLKLSNFSITRNTHIVDNILTGFNSPIYPFLKNRELAHEKYNFFLGGHNLVIPFGYG